MAENPSNMTKLFDLVRNIFSTVITMASIALIGYAMYNGYAALEAPIWLQYVLLILVLTLLAYLEGLQVAILALERVDSESWAHKKRAFAAHKLAVANHGLNVQRFLVGRQFFVIFVVYLIAQLTTYSTLELGVPDFFRILIFDIGLPGALIVLAFGQLMPQLIASTHPILFMNMPFTWSVIQLCLVFESIGVTHFSWVLTFVTKFIFRLDKGDVVIRGSPKNTKKVSPRKKKSPTAKGEQKDELFDSFINREEMTVNILDLNSLYSNVSGAVIGTETAPQETQDWLKDDSLQNIFAEWGDKEGEPGNLPNVETIVRHLIKSNKPVPRYLLPKFHPQHIPPHIVVLELVKREEQLRSRSTRRGDEA